MAGISDRINIVYEKVINTMERKQGKKKRVYRRWGYNFIFYLFIFLLYFFVGEVTILNELIKKGSLKR